MSKLIPIINFVMSLIATLISIIGLVFSALTVASDVFGAIAIVFILIGFTMSVINAFLGFTLTKSKLCITSGIISTATFILNVVSFLIII